MKRLAAVLALLLLAGCHAPTDKPQPAPRKVAAGLVALPCETTGPLAPVNRGYCRLGRNYVRAPGLAVLNSTALSLRHRWPGLQLRYMEASWAKGVRPMPPHLSHGDGRQIDLALFYLGKDGQPLAGPPKLWGYEAFEPPRRESERVCVGKRGKNDRPDPPRDRSWRLDETRTAALVRTLAADPRVRRIFIEPHLKTRLGLAGLAKVRFAGCQAARHDDHIHVDFF